MLTLLGIELEVVNLDILKSQNIKRGLVYITLLLSFLLRASYALFFSDAQSGQDAPSYLLSVERILKDGPFASETSAPAFPIGYPWFVALIWKIFGQSFAALGIFQNILLVLALFMFFKIVTDHFGYLVGYITLLLLCFNPAISASVSLLSYEIPMASFVILGFYCLHKSVTQRLESKSDFLLVILGGTFFAIAISFQPKILLSAISIGAILILSRLSPIDRRKKVVASALLVIFILLAPTATILRNFKAGDGIGYTQNFSTNVFVGTNNSGAEIDYSGCPGGRYDSMSKTTCLLIKKLNAPSENLKIMLHQGVYFWTPFIGNLKFMGTWYHGFDVRRLISGYTWWDQSTHWYKIDRVTGYLWTICLLSLILFGFILSFKISKSKVLPYLYAYPIIDLWFVSVITYGEPRYRLPILPFYTVFLSISIAKIVVTRRRRVYLSDTNQNSAR